VNDGGGAQAGLAVIDARPPGPDGLDFPAGGGTMGARMRAMDWSATALGPPDRWPQSLKAIIRVLLTSRFAMWMAWGPELTFFCNDAYLPTTGLKQDWVLGARSDRVWAEIWPDIGPRIDHVLATGQATWDEQLPLYLERRGFVEESYHTFSYSPLAGDDGGNVGMLCVVAEVTDRVITERQLATLRDLGARLSGASTREEVMAAIKACLAETPQDLPVVLTYLAESDGTALRLAALHGMQIPAGGAAEPPDFAAAWPWREVLRDRTARLVPVPLGLAASVRLLHWQRAPSEALVAPILRAESEAPAGILVAALNPHRALDTAYRGFIDLLTGQIAAAIARADEYESARARADALAELDRAKTAFFSNVSHEFRTPLTLLLAPLEDVLADRSALPPAHAGRIEVAHRNALRLLRLVNTLLDFSRIEAGRADARFRPTDLGELTADLASSFGSAFEAAGLALEVACPALPERIFVDRDMWEKIVLNLLSNAFKFTFEGGAAIRLSLQAGRAVLQVEDTGTGIPAAELPKLFDRFHRVENAAGRSFEGSGIGLALVSELVGLHGGDIEVRSEVGRGTVFSVSIPAGTAHLPPDQIRPEPDAPSAASPGARRAEAFVGEALRWLPDAVATDDDIMRDAVGPAPAHPERSGFVLLADDNADLRDYVRRLLAAQGYEVATVPDGEAALEAVRARRPDLLVSDVMMPRRDGFSLLAAIRADAALRDLPVIILSARAGAEAQVEGLDAGADDYLAKPFSARELIARVGANLEMARVRRLIAEALRDSEARLSLEREFLGSVLAKAPIGMAVVDAAGRVTMLNQRGADLLGRTKDDPPPGTGIASVALRADGTPYTPSLDPAGRAARGERIEAERVTVPRGGGDRIVLELEAEPIHDAAGRPAGAVIVFSDAGARDHAEAALRQRVAQAVAERETALAQLHEVAKLETIGQLTGGVAHDFNNLLTPILGSLDMLRRRVGSDARAMRHIDAALQAAERSRILVQRLLSFARRQTLEARPVDIAALVSGMIDFLQRTLGPDVRLAFDVAGDVRAATVDPNQLELAILNLCVNARDAMPAGGALTIAIANAQAAEAPGARLAEGPYVRLTVSDTGAGMDEDTRRRAVEPFFTTKETGRGTGLGLSMVHGLAAQSNGAFTLASELGQGTRASLFLPAADHGAPRAEAPPASVPAPCHARLLLVDDDAMVRSTTAQLLADLGYEVIQASSADQALDLIREPRAIDAAVTDFRMPGMNGMDLARRLRELRPDMPVLLITGYATSNEQQAIDIPQLAKPFRQAELAARVAQLLEGAG
jgi:signal transduction histidine kinase/DNA-binding response OmpR family regulator